MNNFHQDLLDWLDSAIVQVDLKLKEYRTKADPSKRKVGDSHQPKGSKTDNFKRTADQIEEHKKMLVRIQKLAQANTQYMADSVVSLDRAANFCGPPRQLQQVLTEPRDFDHQQEPPRNLQVPEP